MLEALVAATATTGLFALAKGLRGQKQYSVNTAMLMTSREDRGDDLPCPWCYGPTLETDERCQGCGQAFG